MNSIKCLTYIILSTISSIDIVSSFLLLVGLRAVYRQVEGLTLSRQSKIIHHLPIFGCVTLLYLTLCTYRYNSSKFASKKGGLASPTPQNILTRFIGSNIFAFAFEYDGEKENTGYSYVFKGDNREYVGRSQVRVHLKNEDDNPSTWGFSDRQSSEYNYIPPKPKKRNKERKESSSKKQQKSSNRKPKSKMNNKQRQRNQYKSQTQPGYNQFFGGGDNAFGNIFEDIFSNLFSQGPHSQTGSRSGGANSKGYQYTFFGSGPSGFQFGGPSGGSRRSGGNHYSVPPNFVDRNDIIKSYKKLGVSESASSDEVKKAYRKLALKYHPDKCKKSDCESKMMEINEAYDKVLKDIETKK